MRKEMKRLDIERVELLLSRERASELKVTRKINYLLGTTSQMPDWEMYTSVLAP